MVDRTGLAGLWGGWGAVARASAIGGLALVLVLTASLAWWVMRRDYGTLFSQLSEQDAAVITEELRRQKIPYRLADGGGSVQVLADQVNEIRLRLMSAEMPLNGVVGFEIFDRQGLGATEQAQRVSYQRALQGELARTIGAIDGVKQARVHLVLPEASIFRRDREEPRAAVSLALQDGASLGRAQIAGIQRLVAASVASLSPAAVVVTDQSGLTLSPTALSAAGGVVSDGQLALKEEVETYLTGKVARLLDRALGPGQAIVSVDATLNFDAITTTVEDVIPAAGGDSAAVLRRRESVVRRNPMADLTVDSDAAADARDPVETSEVEYERGRRMEQVVGSPGGIVRISVGVVLPRGVDVERRSQLGSLVSAAAGLDTRRGDSIVIQSLGIPEPAGGTEGVPPAPSGPVNTPESADGAAVGTLPTALAGLNPDGRWLAVLLLALLAGLAVTLLARRAGAGSGLSAEQRDELVADLKRSLAETVRPGRTGGGG